MAEAWRLRVATRFPFLFPTFLPSPTRRRGEGVPCRVRAFSVIVLSPEEGSIDLSTLVGRGLNLESLMACIKATVLTHTDR